MNRPRRSRRRIFALAASLCLHAALLAALLDGRAAPPPPSAPVMVTLYDSAGPTSGPAPGPASGPAAAAEAAPEESAAPAIAEPAPSPPETSPAVETPPVAEAAPPEPPPPPLAEAAPDFTTDPVDPTAALAAAIVRGTPSEAVSDAPGDATAALASLGGAGDPCQLTEWLQGLLADDPFVRAALARLPLDRRSVANAVMLWDGRWAEARTGAGEDLLQPVRQAITTRLAQAPAECRDYWMAGPRFISVTDQRRPTTLALGSGLWRWADLLGPEIPGAPTPLR